MIIKHWNSLPLSFKLLLVLSTITLILSLRFFSQPSQANPRTSPQMVEQKLKMVKKLASSVKLNEASPDEFKEDWNSILESVVDAQKMSSKRRWRDADKLLSSAIEELRMLKTKMRSSGQRKTCNGQLEKLRNTATTLLQIIKNSESPIEGDNNTSENLSNLLEKTSKESPFATQECNVFMMTIKSAIKQIENRYEDNTVYVELDLSTPLKRYLYDINRYKTYEILLKNKLDAQMTKENARKTINSLYSKASKLRNRAITAYNSKNYTTAEKLQSSANSNLTKALQATGLYITE